MLCWIFWESRQKFPCLTADPTVAGCETDVQYNLYIYRFLERRVRQAERRHGERRIDAHQRRDLVQWIPLDMKVQAVDQWKRRVFDQRCFQSDKT